MNVQNAKQFANWLAKDQPALFVELYKRAAMASGQLKDFTDVLSSIGTGISNAVSNVGTFLTSQDGMKSLTTLANSYLQNQAAQAAVNVNLSRAQSGFSPAPIQTRYNPATNQYEAVVPQGNSYVPINTVPSLVPSGFSSIPTWVYFAAGGTLLVLLLLSRR